jgi:hypothetical protein
MDLAMGGSAACLLPPHLLHSTALPAHTPRHQAYCLSACAAPAASRASPAEVLPNVRPVPKVRVTPPAAIPQQSPVPLRQLPTGLDLIEQPAVADQQGIVILAVQGLAADLGRRGRELGLGRGLDGGRGGLAG